MASAGLDLDCPWGWNLVRLLPGDGILTMCPYFVRMIWELGCKELSPSGLCNNLDPDCRHFGKPCPYFRRDEIGRQEERK